MGISAGAIKVRAKISANTSKPPPNTTANGNTRLCEAPVNKRAKCGLTNPTKPIMPAAATVKATNSAVQNITCHCSFLTETPKACALSSPSSKASKDCKRLDQTTSAGTSAATITITQFQLARSEERRVG